MRYVKALPFLWKMIYKGVRSKGLNLDTKPPCTKICWVSPPPPSHEPQKKEETHLTSLKSEVRWFLVKSFVILKLRKQSSFPPYESLYFLILHNSAGIHISSLGHLWYTEPTEGVGRDWEGRINKFVCHYTTLWYLLGTLHEDPTDDWNF